MKAIKVEFDDKTLYYAGKGYAVTDVNFAAKYYNEAALELDIQKLKGLGLKANIVSIEIKEK